MPAVEDRNRKQVNEPEIDRQDRHEPEDCDDPALSDLAGHLRNAQRPAEFVRAPRSLDHLPQRAQGPGGQIPGLLAGLQHGRRGIAFDVFHPAPRDTEQADLVMVTEAIGQLRPARCHVQRLLLAVAPHDDGHRHVRIETHRLLHILETTNRPPIDL